jgi:uncharacterized protein YPO0396
MSDTQYARTIHPGQFRLVRLQVVNWGTFCGYKDFPIDERGVLLTGPSGSGKSSLMDAHSLALLPTTDQRFNASADLTARGAKQSTRTVAEYVRGAWSRTSDEKDLSQVQYLRAGKPTWSAVAATYDNGLGAITTAVAVRWFTGMETDGSALKPMYQLHDGHFDLTALQGWAEREFDTRWLKATYPAIYSPSQTAYVRDLSQRIGLGSSATGPSLLGKAKAMKNVGDLNLFIRDNMLDEPDTFAAAQRVVDAFTPLNDAFETASRAHAQAHTLRDVPGNWTTYHESGQTGERAAALLGAPVEHYLRGVYLQALEAELDRLDTAVAELDDTLKRQNEEEDRKYGAFRSLDEQWRQASTALQGVEAELKLANAEATARREAYRVYSGYVTRLQQRCPYNEASFAALRDRLSAIEEQATTEKAAVEPERVDKFATAAKTKGEHRERADELLALQSAKTLIPVRIAERREEIARGARVPLTELAYAAELIDIAPGQERWRPAAEKVLRSFGLRLLVPDRYKDVVRHYIDEHDMRGVVEYSIVTAVSAHQPVPSSGTLAGKLTVDASHPSGRWLAAQLARRFEHVCVETASELEGHRVAVTVRGTVKMPGNHYRKDDRPELTNPSTYILGANTAAKRAALAREVADLAAAEAEAAAEAKMVDERYRTLEAMIEAVTHVREYPSWDTVDHWSTVRTIDDLKKRIAEIKADNVDLQRLEQKCETAEGQYKDAAQACAVTRAAIERHSNRQNELIAVYEDEEQRPHTINDSDDRAYLDEVLTSLDVEPAIETIQLVRAGFRAKLQKRKDDAEANRKLASTRLKNAIDQFIEKWPDAAPDNSGDVERCGEAFAALHDEIATRRLPEAMTKFQQMISEDMVPSISLLHRAIEQAADEIKRRADMVNAGLRRAEFNPGTHLQIAYKVYQPSEVKDFRKLVDELLSNAPAARRDPNASVAQFRRVRNLMARFTGTSVEARRWRGNVLDVRNSYTFYGREKTADDTTVFTYHNTASNSGGEQEKLVAFCLAAALSYNLADQTSDGRPHFAPLMLDEAFSKSDETFAGQALAVFEEFGFQLIIAAPIRMSGIVEPFIGQAILVEKRMTPEGTHSNAAYATFGELAARRDAELEGATHAAV